MTNNIKKISDTHEQVMNSLFDSIVTPKTFRFETINEATIWYEENVNSNSNNMNPEFERVLDAWLEDNTNDIRESYEENNTTK